jgi:NAD(P)-dependent dehydrogenase (short-subunit alcohol dehydrogenase family)
MKEFSHTGKCAVITGGTGELGTAVVRRFLEEGMKVAISYRNPGDLGRFSESVRAHILAVQTDVTIESQVIQLFETTLKSMGPIDIVVNTVGGFVPSKLITDVTVDEWDRMMNMNLKTTFLCTREALRRMKGRTYGRIINISAMSGLRPSVGRSAYAVSKSAVSLFTEIAGMEQKGSGITVNAIAPSIIDTEANRKSMPGEDYSRWVKPENIADIICYLCSDNAGDITGTTIKASGGV